jgi:uncharacterized protein (TIGR02145 family)
MKSKYRLGFYSFSLLGSILFLTSGCEKEKPARLPELSTVPLTNITSTSFISGGIVTSDGGEMVTGRGVCWGTEFNPTVNDNNTTDGDGTGSFISAISGLESGTDYYVRAYATNSFGTAYGNAFFFITPVTDVDGNVYNTVPIENMVWMAANLKTTKYNDNSQILNVTDNEEWSNLSEPAYCWYKNNESAYKNKYGALYNWFAINTGKLCPNGWHVPCEAEWTALTDYLGGEYVAGGKLKELGLINWISPNLGATNESGFTALPGGYRTGLDPGSFRAAGYIGWWWASNESALLWARNRTLAFDAIEIARGQALKKNGYSVRCVKN